MLCPREGSSSFFYRCVHDYYPVAFVSWKHDDVPVQVLEGQSLLSSDVWWREFGFEKDIGYLSADIICLF